MTVLTNATKIAKVDEAFAQVVSEQMKQDNRGIAKKTLAVFDMMDNETKVKLFDLLTK
jgi:hypothetical protein